MTEEALDAVRRVYDEWGSGALVDTKGAHVWTLRDGKAIRLVIFATRERALAEVGLAPGREPLG